MRGWSRSRAPRFERLAQFKQSESRRLEILLDDFASLRRQSLADLPTMTLSDADLGRRGHHPALGTVTLRQLLGAGSRVTATT